MAEVFQVVIDPRGAKSGAGEVKRSFQTVGSSASSTTATIAKFAAAMGLAFSVRAIVNFTKDAIRSYAEFDAAMTQSLAIMGDVSSAMREDMVEAARRTGEQLNFSAKEGAEAFFFLASAGLSAADSVAALPQVAAFAKAGMFSFATATDLATDAQSALGLAVKGDAIANLENMARVTDVLVIANTKANATVEEFATALTTKAGASLRSVNKEIEEGVAVLAVFADQGIKGQLAGNALARAINLLGEGAINNKKAFKDLNIEVFDDQENFRNFADIIEDMEVAFEGMGVETKLASLSQLGFTARVKDVILPLLGASDAIRDYEESFGETGRTMEVAEKQMLTMTEQFGALQQRLINLGHEFIQGAGQDITTALQNINEWFDANRIAIIVWGEVAVKAIKAVAVSMFELGGIAVDSAQAILGFADSSLKALTFRFDEAREALAEAGSQFGQTADRVKHIADVSLDYGIAVNMVQSRIKELTLEQEANAATARRLARVAAAVAGDFGSFGEEVEGVTVAVRELTDAEKAAIAASQRIVVELAKEAEQAEALARAQMESAEAAKELARIFEVENAVIKATSKVTEDYKDVVEELTRSIYESGFAAEDAAEEQARLAEATAEAARVAEEAVRARLKAELDAAKKAAEPWLEAARQIQNIFAEAFDNIFDGAIDGFDDLADQVFDVFKGLAAQIASALALDKLGINDAIAGLRGGDDIGSTLGKINLPGVAGAAVGGGFVSIIGGFFQDAAESRKRHEQMALDRLDQERKATEQFLSAVQQFESAVGGTPSSLTAAFDELNELLNATVRSAKPRTVDPLDVEAERLALEERLGEKISEVTDRYQEELAVRSLLAQGLDAEATQRQFEIAQRQELFDAVRAGWDDVTLAMLENVQAAELAAFEAEQLARAEAKLAEQRRQAMESAAFDRDIVLRRIQLEGTAREAFEASAKERVRSELLAAKALVDAGKITETQFQALSVLLGDELVDALRIFDEQLAEAEAARLESVKRLAEAELEAARIEKERVEALERANLLALEDIQIRELIAKGMQKEAELRAFELKQQRELERFTTEGFSSAVLEALAQTQALELAGFLTALSEKFAPPDTTATDLASAEQRSVAGFNAGGGNVSVSSSAASEVTTQRLSAINLAQLAVLQEIAANTRGMRGGGGGDVNAELGQSTVTQLDQAGRVGL